MCRLFKSLRDFGWEIANSLQISSSENKEGIYYFWGVTMGCWAML